MSQDESSNRSRNGSTRSGETFSNAFCLLELVRLATQLGELRGLRRALRDCRSARFDATMSSRAAVAPIRQVGADRIMFARLM